MLAITETAISGRIASGAHTIRLMLILVVLAAGGLLFRWHLESLRASPVHPSGNHVSVYLSVIASEWMLFRAVRAGIRRTGMNWHDLVGASAFARKGFLGDLAMAAVVVTAWVSPVVIWSAASVKAGASGLLPHGGIETLLWVALSVTAGICEEFTFRGYFQRQFAAVTKNAWLGLVLQAALFGVVHSYQGISASMAIAAYGAVLGGLAAWRGNLRAAMIAHSSTDLVMGLFLR